MRFFLAILWLAGLFTFIYFENKDFKPRSVCDMPFLSELKRDRFKGLLIEKTLEPGRHTRMLKILEGKNERYISFYRWDEDRIYNAIDIGDSLLKEFGSTNICIKYKGGNPSLIIGVSCDSVMSRRASKSAKQ